MSLILAIVDVQQFAKVFFFFLICRPGPVIMNTHILTTAAEVF